MIRSFFYTSQTHKLIAEELAISIGLKAMPSREDCHEAHLELSDAGLFFFHPDARASNKFHIDFHSGSSGWRLKRADHEKLIKKALGKSDKPLRILDCTAGLLQDTLLFLSLGHQVTAVEQSKLLFLLLQDALRRSRASHGSLLENLTLIQGNACMFIKEADNFDVVYFDPMYPTSKKTALGSGQLDYLAKVLEIEGFRNEPQEDFEVLRLMPVKKMIVKRPIKAKAFAEGINYKVPGKTTRFDVYI
jgi:16S rRNA (guanine1516-N2)-methyltransferase